MTFSIDRTASRTKRITWSALSGLASSGAIAIISIFSAPITINYLGKDLYGIWVIITSFLLWAQLFDFGILNGLTNALSEAFGRDDFTSAQRYICTSFVATAFISALGMITWVLLSYKIPWQNFIKVDTVEQGLLLGRGICVAGFFFLLSLPFLLCIRVLHAYQRMYVAHGISFIAYLLTLVGLLIGVHNRFGIIELLVAINILPIIWYILCWHFIKKKIPWMRFSRQHMSSFALRRVAFSSFPLLILQLINIITSQAIPIMLTYVATLKDVADFNILWKMYLFVFVMMLNISAPHNPSIRDAYERGEFEWIKKAVKRLLMIQGILIILGCVPLLIAGNGIIQIWIRMPLEHTLSVTSWLIFTLCIFACVFNATLSHVLLILDKIRPQIYLTFLSSMCLFFGIIWGVPRAGLVAIFGVMSFTACVSSVFSLRILKRLLLQRRSR